MKPAPDPVDVLIVGERRADALRSLGREGLRIEHRDGLFPALALLRRHGARLVVLGHEDVEGREPPPVEEIRSAGAERVLLLCPESVRADRERVRRIGADDALAEPCYAEDLEACVRTLLADRPDGPRRHDRSAVTGAPSGLPPRSAGGATGPRSVVSSAPPPAASPMPAGGPIGPTSDRPSRSVSRLADPSVTEILLQIHRAARDLPVLRTVLVQTLGRMTRARRASLMLHRPASRDLFLVEASGLPEDVPRGHRVKVGRGVAGRVAERARPVVVPDIEASEFRDVARGARYETRSFLSIPLVADARILGVLSFADREDAGPFGPEDLEAILPIADAAAADIWNALLIRKLRAASMLDRLTGLYNRRYFERVRQRELKMARRYKHPLSLLLLDADRFKHINDAGGHPAGDDALRAVGALLREVFRETDVVCRIGGDEFAVLMPETDAERARQVVERLERALGRTRIPGEEHVPGGKLGLSSGLATFPEDGMRPEDLVSRADDALYEEKRRRSGEAPGTTS